MGFEALHYKVKQWKFTRQKFYQVKIYFVFNLAIVHYGMDSKKLKNLRYI